ncbi:MAG: DNA polymerase domain-containing protein [Thermoplasmatota archaeon]
MKTDRSRAISLRAPFTPSFYVAGPRDRLDGLAARLPLVPSVGAPSFETKRLGLSPESREVLRVPVRDSRRVWSVAQMVDALGEHRDFDLYDVDLRMSQRYFFERGLFPFARVAGGNARELRALDGAWDMDYAPPALAEATLGITVAASGARVAETDRVTEITVDDAKFEGREEDVLADAAREVAKRDPDIVYTHGGDRWALAHLARRAVALGIAEWSLGRERVEMAPRREKTFFQYGHIRYRAPTFPLPGRIHVDLDESFFFGEAGLGGVVDLSRISGIPLAELARLEAGTAVTAIQIDEAKRQGRLIPWKKNLPEKPKTLRALVAADRGGYIFDPRVGLHEDVIELDFSSLYPALIANHNLGAEAILCSCCDPATLPPENFVPQTGYHVCRERALVPRVLERLVARRAHLKRRRKEDPSRRAEYQGRIDALKWLNVVSFGYQGYKNARFGAIEGHEATCAWGRETLLTASDVARDHGYEILHGIVDSLWLERVIASPSDVETLAKAVERATGIPFDPQGRYKWIVFLPTRASLARPWGAQIPVGAPNRFYGCFDTIPDAPTRSQAGQDVDYLAGGALKVRGVELRQSSTPQIVTETQEAALRVFARAETADAFRASIPAALAAARAVVERIRRGGCAARELVVTLRVTQELESYRQMNHGHAALKQLARRGVHVSAGDAVRFVITDTTSRDAEARVRELRLGAEDGIYDRDAYEALAVRSLASLLLPLGWDEARVADAMRSGPKQTLLV